MIVCSLCRTGWAGCMFGAMLSLCSLTPSLLQASWLRGESPAPPVIQPTAEEAAARQARADACIERLSAISGVPVATLTAYEPEFMQRLEAAMNAPPEPCTAEQAVAAMAAAAARYRSEAAAAVAKERGASGSAGVPPADRP